MNNAELIKAARICANQTCCDNCPRYDIDHTQDAQRCCIQLINDTADALEAADKRIEELENDLRDGTISNPERFKIYGYTLRDLILFADMCKRNDVHEADLKQAAWNLELAVRAVQNERMEIVKKFSDEMSYGISVLLIPNFEKAYEEMWRKEQTDAID